ncbi:HAD-like domain-containing protein [Cladorrhinum samala]|uniref:HAD-like domain-containing protein n=1 Tax=Cladorrhinum samala TaxID=585594 RepID=A0AAV9HCU0_9PEZI|nr:HAD-like domain-containing protein [Cladorrhinum samala]
MKNIILLDFDGTITSHDTINIIASLATARNPRAGPIWDDIVTKYVADHADHLSSYKPEACDRTTLTQELEYLASLGSVEQKSVERVAGLGVFAAIPGEEFRAFGEKIVDRGESETGAKGGGVAVHGDEDGEAEAAEKVKLRRGLHGFLDWAGKRGWEFGVVSVNWSREFIEGVLLDREEELGGGRRIKANSINWPAGRVEGYEQDKKVLMTVEDKVRAMRDLVVEIKGEGGQEEEGERNKGKVVYFGDSTTDIGCLIEADLGVVMADEDGSKLLKTLRRVGMEVAHVKDFKGKKGLVWARDFEEVLESRVMERLEG